VLETQEFMRLGSETVTKVDVRIIAATNKNLQREVDSKKFRNDLYFRLKAVSLNIPPLRERRGDILDLTSLFIKNYSNNNRRTPPQITHEAEELLVNYNWPGNIRELKNVIETSIALNRTGTLDVDSFIPLLTEKRADDELRNLPVHLNRSAESLDREMIYRALIEIKKDLNDLKQIADKNQSDINNSAISQSTNEVVRLDEIEKRAILNAINFTKYNRRRAAQMLGISERTLYRKLKDYGIE
jgi:DNA-binding NtrC family response regulator